MRSVIVYVRDMPADPDAIPPFAAVADNTPEGAALRAWLKRHRIDARNVAEHANIIRDEQQHRISIDRVFVRDASGYVMRDPNDQLAAWMVPYQDTNEAGPLPYPPEIQAVLRP